MFDKMRIVFGDLSIRDNRIAFQHCYERTAFFRLTELDPAFLQSVTAVQYPEFFMRVMDESALRQDKKGWVQKSNSLNGELIASSITDAEFVIIQRDPIQNLLSKSLRDNKRLKIINSAAELFGYAFSKKVEHQFHQKHDALLVSFAELKSDTEATLRRVCDHLDLSFSKEMLESHFSKNTTFKKNDRPELGSLTKLSIRSTLFLISLLPLPVMYVIRKWLGRHRKTNRRFVAGTFEL